MTRLTSALLAGVLLSSLASAADISGTWTGTLGGPVYLVLKQEGGKLSGTGGPNLKEQMLSFENGKVEGDRITFKVGPYAFDLQMDGETMKGNARNGEQSVPVFLKRPAVRATTDPLPAFEVAAVKLVSPAPVGGYSSSLNLNPGRLTATNVSLKKLIVNAYGMKDYQFSGPDWMTTEVYDITASMSANTAGEDVLLMLQSLLAERFQLKFHREDREMPVYALMVGKTGSKLHETEFGPGSTSVTNGTLTAKSVPVRSLTNFLSRQLDRPVLDMTDLKGVFNFELEWAPERKAAAPGADPVASDPASGPSLFTAVQEQLGLKLESRKAPIEMLVVDSALKVPTGN